VTWATSPWRECHIAKPSTVTDNLGINCDKWACPYLSQGIYPYQGPMGYEGHCESYVASSANWDLAQSLVATTVRPRAAAMDSIWYKSLIPARAPTRSPPAAPATPRTVNGCAATNWYTVFLSADDDNGNLADGTPNGCRIWDAFNAHGIGVRTRPACAGGCTPQAVANAGATSRSRRASPVTIGTAAVANTTYSWSPGGQTTAADHGLPNRHHDLHPDHHHHLRSNTDSVT